MPTDLAIAREAAMKPIGAIAAKLGLGDANVLPIGHTKAKIDLKHLAALPANPEAKLILVTGISPTPAGEGKTTTTVGLGDALQRIGKKTAICLREPSLGPCFGVKGGAAGGGYAQVVPMEDINLHFTGDFHAITSSHNLLSAMLDNHIYWGNALGIDARRIHWRRVVDLNDRALRSVVSSLGGAANGFPREDGFDITVASEVMAILCLATGLDDLQKRLDSIIVAETCTRELVHAADLQASGSMTALLREALNPNLVQTLEHTPAFVHGGPFGNIAHGCNSVIATAGAMKLADYVVTEAGFGADLGAEKFFDIKCRKSGLRPDAAVIVATVRALKMHGGVPRAELGGENVPALREGCANLLRHIENVKGFGVPAVVGINRFTADTDAEIAAVREACASAGVEAVECTHWGDGGEGAEALANAVIALAGQDSRFDFLYPDDLSLWDKIETVSKKIYRAGAVMAPPAVRRKIETYEKQGFGRLPVCMAKTQMSFSTDPTRMGAPVDHELHVRDVRLAAGAGFLVAVCGDIMTMPGLPREPAANRITVNAAGQIEGLF
ncbi:MAG: formate--tetrahydrofolate ligase [Alphaproteobacteria bacterium]|nr:formate--tetrahydrofolate ligase [Alphaproteobacteria bacterium]